jgi:hypothetical protein
VQPHQKNNYAGKAGLHLYYGFLYYNGVIKFRPRKGLLMENTALLLIDLLKTCVKPPISMGGCKQP